VRHEAVDSVSRRRSHQERSVSSRPRVVAFEEAALEWPTTDRTLGRDAPSLAPWRRWRGPTNVPLRANDRVRRQRTERTPYSCRHGLRAARPRCSRITSTCSGSGRWAASYGSSLFPACSGDGLHYYWYSCSSNISRAMCPANPRAPGWLGTRRSRSSASSSPYRAANHMLEYVPAHAPELNAVAYIPGCWERHGPPPCTHNFGPTRS
jgi:hypothetical protein